MEKHRVHPDTRNIPNDIQVITRDPDFAAKYCCGENNCGVYEKDGVAYCINCKKGYVTQETYDGIKYRDGVVKDGYLETPELRKLFFLKMRQDIHELGLAKEFLSGMADRTIKEIRKQGLEDEFLKLNS